MTTNQPESLKTFYAIYDRTGSERRVVRMLEAEDIDTAWEIAETLETGLYNVEDIPPTGDVEFLDNSVIP
ncbi:hypothetical protein [Coleofasciculus sp. H7-2]|uniref:hypothetical protein n=1 Tax=Coleofasciculus sp. H7-2 TaxID=3351545 RepID=UPI00366CA7A7